MSTPPREPPLTLASALPIALVLHVKNRVAEERRCARRRARLEDQLVQAGKLRDRLVALVRASARLSVAEWIITESVSP